MPIEVEKIIDGHEKSIKEIFNALSSTATNQKLMSKDIQYMGEKVTALITSTSTLEKTVSKLALYNKNKEERWKEIKSQWYKIIGLSITLATIFTTYFEIIKQPTH